jgi:protein-tyrosine phosphatase
MERPLNYSWILPGRLAVGETPVTLAELVSLGFRGVLNLQERSEPQCEEPPPEGLSCRQVPIRDGIVGGVPSLDQLESAVEALRNLIDAGLPTYVHCYAGVGRSPTVCMAYLARIEGLSPDAAYRRVASAHPPTAPTEGQLWALAEFLAAAE